jgi:hypothetical protein
MAYLLLGRKEIEVTLLDDMTTQAEESVMFSDCNDDIKGIAHTLRYGNQFTQGNKLIVGINNILVNNGFTCIWDITTVRKDSFICEATLVDLYGHDVGHSLNKTLAIMNKTWGDDKTDRQDMLKSPFLVGLFRFIVKYHSYLETTEQLFRFIKKCKRMSPKEINKDSTTGTTNKYESTFKSLYNYGLPKVSNSRID